MRRIRFRHAWDGGIVETDVFIGRREEWDGSPESTNPEWSVRTRGRSVVAVRLPNGLPRYGPAERSRSL